MKDQETNRVLGRTGARELTPEEVERVSGSGPQNSLLTFQPATGFDHKE